MHEPQESLEPGRPLVPFRFLGAVAGIGIYAIAAVVAYDVASRWWGVGVRWPPEIYLYLMLWVGLIAIPYTTILDGHVRMDLLAEEGWLGPFERIQPHVVLVASLAYIGLMAWGGYEMLTSNLEMGRRTGQLRWPLALHVSALPFSMVLTGAALVAHWAIGRRRRRSTAQVEAGEMGAR